MSHSKKGHTFTAIVLHTFRLGGLLAAEGDRITAEFGLSSARWKVLGALQTAGTPLTVPQIAHAMGQTRQGVQRLVGEMAEDGLLQLSDNPLHKRARLVAPSARGSQVYALLESRQAPWANAISAGLSQAELATTAAVLQRLIGILEARR